MNRRNLFQAAGATCGALILGSNAEVREVHFVPPNETPVFYWTRGHVSDEIIVSLCSILEGYHGPIEPSAIKREWGTFKLSKFSIYLSDRPREGFEPITYWTPTDS